MLACFSWRPCLTNGCRVVMVRFGNGLSKGTGKSMRTCLSKLPFSNPPFSFSQMKNGSGGSGSVRVTVPTVPLCGCCSVPDPSCSCLGMSYQRCLTLQTVRFCLKLLIFCPNCYAQNHSLDNMFYRRINGMCIDATNVREAQMSIKCLSAKFCSPPSRKRPNMRSKMYKHCRNFLKIDTLWGEGGKRKFMDKRFVHI